MTEAPTGNGQRRTRLPAEARPAGTGPITRERGVGLPDNVYTYGRTGQLEDPIRPSKQDIEAMVARDPQVQALMIAIRLPLFLSPGRLEPGEGDSGEHAFVEEVLLKPPWQGGMSTPIGLVLQQELTALFYRQAFFEKVWARDEAGRFRYKKLAFRPATTCRVRHDVAASGEGNGSFDGFTQEGVKPGSGRWFSEDFEPLYAYVYVHGHADRPLLGTSLLQTAWHEHDHKNKLRWLQARGFAKFGTGVLISQSERQNEEDINELTDALNDVLDGGVAVVGPDEMPQLLSATTLPDYLDALQYVDTGMARSVLLQAMQLGTGSNTGSWALSKDHTDFFLMAEEAQLRAIEQNRNAYMIPPLVEQNFPGSRSYPRWTFPGLSKEGKALAKEIFMALVGRPGSSTQPVIQAAIEKQVAEDLGADPGLIPDHDDPAREQVPEDVGSND